MRGGRSACVVAVVAAFCVPAAASPAGGAPGPWSIVALGDSVPRGTNCACRPYPLLTAAGLAASSGRRVTGTNDSVAGYTTSNVLAQLSSDAAVIRQVRGAEVVEIQVGANDVGYSKACRTLVPCYTPRLPRVEENLAAIVARVHRLTSGHKVEVVLLDYWSVWLGGRYAAAKGARYVSAAGTMTDRVNAAIRSEAAKSRAAYVDLRAAFKGPSYAYDETHYLSNDGDHPNAAGHRRIAAAVDRAVERALHS